MAHSPASSIQSQGDSSPPEVSTTGVTRDLEGSPSRQGSLRQRRPCKARQHRHTPYENRSPVGSASTSSDESDASEVDNLTVEQKKLKRVAANSRERKRMHTVNGAFDQLRELVPTYPSNRKLSKIDTLRLACSYITDLTSLLRNPAVVHGDDVQLFHQLHEGYMHGSAFSPSSSYPGVQVKTEYGDYCSYPTLSGAAFSRRISIGKHRNETYMVRGCRSLKNENILVQVCLHSRRAKYGVQVVFCLLCNRLEHLCSQLLLLLTHCSHCYCFITCYTGLCKF